MHSGWDWSFKERLYTTTTYNTADETLKGNGCKESEDSRKLRHKFQNSTFQDILYKIDSERLHVAAGIAQFLKTFSYCIVIPFFWDFCSIPKGIPRFKIFRLSAS